MSLTLSCAQISFPNGTRTVLVLITSELPDLSRTTQEIGDGPTLSVGVRMYMHVLWHGICLCGWAVLSPVHVDSIFCCWRQLRFWVWFGFLNHHVIDRG